VAGTHLERVFEMKPEDDQNVSHAFTVTLTGITITNGLASSGDAATGSGGAIRDQGVTSLTLNNVDVTGNIATADGGGISMENTVNTHWTLTINASTIFNNFAGDAGGGIEEDGSGKVIINSGTVIGNNSSVNQGAGIWLDAVANGMVMETANLTITGTFISANEALTSGTFGGGIGNAGNGAVSISNSTIEANISGGDGGGFSDQNGFGTLTVTNSFFLANYAVGNGGGIQEGGPTTSITNTQIQGNVSGGAGGGVFCSGTTLTILDSTVNNNVSSGNGGGISDETLGSSNVTLTNVTITGNIALNNAGTNGGGLNVDDFSGAVALLNDTINANFASSGGGLFWVSMFMGFEGTISVQNTILAQNFLANGGTGVDVDTPGGTITDHGGNLIGVAGDANTGFTAATDKKGTLASPLNPLLGPLTNNGGPTAGDPGISIVLETEMPLAGSPAIGAGVLSGAPSTDERGLPSVVNGKINIGAVSSATIPLVRRPSH
jgi:hypothetical protein